jgi:large repetitive protein
MTLSRHSIVTVLKTAAPRVAVILAFMVMCVVAGTNPAQATIDNVAKATGTYSGNPVVSPPASVSVGVAPALPGLQVTKLATPANNVPAGTTVTYTYTIRNSGNQTLTNVSLNDAHNGSGTPPVPRNESLTTDANTPLDSTDVTPNDGIWSKLAPGDVVTLTSTYIITQTDVDTRQ